MRIVYFGSSGSLSLLPLQSVLAAGYTVCGVVLDAPGTATALNTELPVLIENDDSIAALATLHDIPFCAWSLSPETNQKVLQQFQPDLVLVSCFSKKLPEALLSLPPLGCFNLHPSRLPAYRGPVPLFWQFRDGVTQFGVTLHRMSSRLDAGNIIVQSAIEMPDGVDARRAELLLAQAGSTMLVSALQRMTQGAMKETPQNERNASYQGFPSSADFHVSAAWSARRLYNFLCATCNRGLDYRCEVSGRVYRLAGAERYQPAGRSSLRIDGDQIVIPCRQGVLWARLTRDSR